MRVDSGIGGSSPRLWGTLDSGISFLEGFRFIPTPVGNTSWPSWPPARPPVHPHACGEHGCGAWPTRTASGSSPRLWGTPRRRKEIAVANRFIPTPVGNTLFLTPLILSLAVHPHACGEHSQIPLNQFQADGSSPRLWGTLGLPGGIGDASRFIPTPVGNTSARCMGIRAGTVHPHACGEHLKIRPPFPETFGSSPRLWGTLFNELTESIEEFARLRSHQKILVIFNCYRSPMHPPQAKRTPV